MKRKTTVLTATVVQTSQKKEGMSVKEREKVWEMIIGLKMAGYTYSKISETLGKGASQHTCYSVNRIYNAVKNDEYSRLTGNILGTRSWIIKWAARSLGKDEENVIKMISESNKSDDKTKE